jgi:Zn ribbon nucleic-acid-binding protein
VHKIRRDLAVFEMKGSLFTMTTDISGLPSQTGIGGDDKCGIYMCLRALETMDRVKAVFFRFEETGCRGSAEADMEFFSNCGFVLQCDRRGSSDFITTAAGVGLASEEFKEKTRAIYESYGYKESSGLSTDVAKLKTKKLGVSAANISCGYWDPHTDKETINIEDLDVCEEMVLSIMNEFSGQEFKHEYEAPIYKPATYSMRQSSWPKTGDINIVKSVNTAMYITNTCEFLSTEDVFYLSGTTCPKCKTDGTLLFYQEEGEVFCCANKCYETIEDEKCWESLVAKGKRESFSFNRLREVWNIKKI